MRLNRDDIPLGRMVTRREALALMGLSAAALLAARPVRAAPADANRAPSCVARPSQTQGPFFVEERLKRSDIRADPSTGEIKPGVPLHLTFNVSRISSAGCTALADAQVDVWHCDAGGRYSDVRDFVSSTVGQKFLRGYQMTDAGGNAEFITVYPGWYDGRAVHIHCKIRTVSSSGQRYEFASQLYFDDTLTDRVQAVAPYASHGRRTIRNAGDALFRHGGEQLLLNPTQDAQGYAANFDIGLQIT